MMNLRFLNFRGVMLVCCASMLTSCATSKLAATPEVDTPADETSREVSQPEAEPERRVGTVAVVKSSARGRGFILVRPMSKRTRVDVGAGLEARDGAGLKTATMIRSAEDNRRFFVADIRDGMPSEGDSVVVLAKVPELKKSPSGLSRGSGLLEDFDLSEALSLPPLSDADIKAMEP